MDPFLNLSPLSPNRVRKAKRAFTTRRVPIRDMQSLISGDAKPESGDLLLATVHELGKHRKIEKLTGRRAMMLPGDEIIVCYGNRYAPDQFEAIVSDDLGLCNLVAGGGIASREINRHDRMLPPTQIMPIGLIGDAEGNRLNLINYRLENELSDNPINVILVVGTAMNAGKTFTAASVLRGLKESGYSVAGIKATGTGSGGDLWKMKDMGADVILDFSDAGYASTYLIPDEQIEDGVLRLINHAAERKCEFAIVEIADGLQHLETATLLRSHKLRSITSGVVFAAYDSLGAKAGYDHLLNLGYSCLAISGQVTRSPLAMREASTGCECPIYTPFEIQAGALVPVMTGMTDNALIKHYEDLVKQKTAEYNAYINDFEPRQSDAVWRRDIRNTHSFIVPEDLVEPA